MYPVRQSFLFQGIQVLLVLLLLTLPGVKDLLESGHVLFLLFDHLLLAYNQRPFGALLHFLLRAQLYSRGRPIVFPLFAAIGEAGGWGVMLV